MPCLKVTYVDFEGRNLLLPVSYSNYAEFKHGAHRLQLSHPRSHRGGFVCSLQKVSQGASRIFIGTDYFCNPELKAFDLFVEYLLNLGVGLE